MATGLLDRQTEVVKTPNASAEVTAAAKSEGKAAVKGNSQPGTSRAWDAKAQID